MSELSIWMPLHIDAWQGSASVQCMTDAEHRAFLNLLMEAWQAADCGLPSDDAILAKLSRKRSEWPQLRDVVMEEFDLIEGRYFNAKLLKERRFAEAVREKRRLGAEITNEKIRARKQRTANAERTLSVAGANAERSLSDDCAIRSRTLSTPISTPTPTKDTAFAESVTDALAIERIYLAYPRRVGKPKALAAIEKAVEHLGSGADIPKLTPPEACAFLNERVRAFAQSPAGQAGEFTPHPSTWFNQERYLDDEKEWQRGSNQPDTPKGHQPAANPAKQRQDSNHASLKSVLARRYGADFGDSDAASDGSLPESGARGVDAGDVPVGVGVDGDAVRFAGFSGRVIEGRPQ